MAQAKTDTITKTVEKVVNEKVVNLSLSTDEVNALYALTAFVYGDGSTYNKEISDVRKALQGPAGGSVWATDYFIVSGTSLKARKRNA